MTCSSCSASVPDENRFCEECGKEVRSAGPGDAACACGASPATFDADGYCTACGRVQRPETDHIEAALGPSCAGVSDRGRRHARNEDRFGVRQIPGGHVLVVCDGVSSSTESERASAAGVERMLHCLSNGVAMEAAMAEAQTAVAALPPGATGGDPASTTLVAAVVRDAAVTIGWAGDSRAYWISESETRPLTTDHSWMNEAISSGQMTQSQAATSPSAHAITRWLGADAGDSFQPQIVRVELRQPGWLLLCTDGLWNYAPEAEKLGELFRATGADALPLARKLVEFANGQGGQDNVTAVLLRT